MRSRLACAILLSTLPLLPAHAADMSVTGGVALKFETAGDPDKRQTLNLHAESGFANFYAGVSADVHNASRANELGLSLGYRNTMASGLGYDLSYTHLFYPSDRATYPHTMGDCCADVAADVTMPVGSNLTAGLELTYHTKDETTDAHVRMDYLLSDRLSVGARIGRGRDWAGRDANDWKLSAGYRLGERSKLDLSYSDTDTSAGSLGLGLSWDTNLLGG